MPLTGDRRRAPRVAMPLVDQSDLPRMLWPLTLPVQVAEISENGLLLKSTDPVEPGRRCRLRFALGAEPVAAELLVVRCSPSRSGSTFSIGAVFAAMTDESRSALQRFLKQGGI